MSLKFFKYQTANLKNTKYKFCIIKPKAQKKNYFIPNKIPISMQHEALEKKIPFSIVAEHSDRPKNKSFMCKKPCKPP